MSQEGGESNFWDFMRFMPQSTSSLSPTHGGTGFPAAAQQSTAIDEFEPVLGLEEACSSARPIATPLRKICVLQNVDAAPPAKVKRIQAHIGIDEELPNAKRHAGGGARAASLAVDEGIAVEGIAVDARLIRARQARDQS